MKLHDIYIHIRVHTHNTAPEKLQQEDKQIIIENVASF